MIEINKYKLVPGITPTWGDIIGDITKQQDLVDYVASHGGGGDAVWGSIAGDIGDQEDLNALLANYAMKEWVEGKGYITSSALSSYATEQWVGNQGYLTSTDLNDYVTQTWIENQGYYAPDVAHAPVEYHNLINDPEIEIEYPAYNPKTMRLIEPGEDGFVIGGISELDGDPTLEYVDKIQGVYFGKNASGNYTAGLYQYAVTDKNGSIIYPETFNEFVTLNNLNSYATKSWVSNKGYATQTWVNNQGYLNSSSLSGYATEQWVSSQQFATQSWVSSQGYLTSVPSGYATESWVSSQGYASNNDLTALTSRVSALETNYGDAITITNNILGV